MKASFVGHFAPVSRALAPASSAAGNQVQRQVAAELSRRGAPDPVACYAMTPAPAWPRGPLVSPSEREGPVEFIGYPNLPAVKHLIFAIRLLLRLLRDRPGFVLQYNSYLLENLALLAYRALRSRVVLGIIVQDVHVEPGAGLLSRAGIRSMTERASLHLAGLFDRAAPISTEIIRDFGFDPERAAVFQGGITEFGAALLECMEPPDPSLAVFAGALEPHNGIGPLLDRWLADPSLPTLHVFGRGSLSERVARAASGDARIVYHGLQPEAVVMDWQRRAAWNICLRYSDGINQTYFFPSKLFNILCAPGVVVVNDFHALPQTLRPHLCVVPDDLGSLGDSMRDALHLTSPDRVRARRDVVRARHSWQACIDRMYPADPRAAHA